MTRQVTGDWGEACAAEHLQQRGWEILHRNYHSAYGEIDIVACDSQYVLFVEVKTRAASSWGTPAEAVTREKQRRICKTAQVYLQQYPLPLQPRFDVCEVYVYQGDSRRRAQINYIQNAFF